MQINCVQNYEKELYAERCLVVLMPFGNNLTGNKMTRWAFDLVAGPRATSQAQVLLDEPLALLFGSDFIFKLLHVKSKVLFFVVYTLFDLFLTSA